MTHSQTRNTRHQTLHTPKRAASATIALLTLLLVFATGTSPARGAEPAGDWPQFLGPNRNGISAETGLIDVWPKDGPREVWRVPGGVGMSGLAILDGRVVTMFQDAQSQRVAAFSVKDGKPLWSIVAAQAYKNQQGDGPRATPALTKDGVYAFTGDGVLLALKPENGEILWKHDLIAEFKGEIADYGMTSSPLIIGDLVVVTPGGKESGLVAYHRGSGKLAWTAIGMGPPGYSSPVVLRLGDADHLIAFAAEGAIAVEPATGNLLWSYPYVTDFGCNIATPLAVNGNVFLSSGENHGSVLLSLQKSGDQFSVKPVWTSQGPQSVLRNEWQTSILLDGYLYGFDNVGSAGPVTHFTCIEAATGKRAWQKLRFGKGNLIAADGKLFLTTIKGELVILRANSKAYEELGRKTVLDTTRQAPALAGGRLYLRDDNEIVCVDVRK